MIFVDLIILSSLVIFGVSKFWFILYFFCASKAGFKPLAIPVVEPMPQK